MGAWNAVLLDVLKQTLLLLLLVLILPMVLLWLLMLRVRLLLLLLLHRCHGTMLLLPGSARVLLWLHIRVRGMQRVSLHAIHVVVVVLRLHVARKAEGRRRWGVLLGDPPEGGRPSTRGPPAPPAPAPTSGRLDGRGGAGRGCPAPASRP